MLTVSLYGLTRLLSVSRQPSWRNPREKRVSDMKAPSPGSGRVLKHVYEDGQELDSPEEKYPHSFLPHGKIPPSHLEMEQLCGFQEPPSEQRGVEPPTGLIAQRINVYRGMGSYKAAAGPTDQTDGDTKSSVLDFGKIIIYTSKLRIVRAPARKSEALCYGAAPPVDAEGHPQARERGSRRRAKAVATQEGERKVMTHTQEWSDCQLCGGSGCTPCSLCHGSKLSMLANRFNESISELRCQACYPHGLERCQACAGKSPFSPAARARPEGEPASQ
ncbi:glutaredoxin domain-containing cysteine-rich protein 2 isoform X2 [Corythoichthys intestinalis]|uniref:glutaredoxin domain-containing cysteine-rich protein 2 isoform X2 n=1 Tax=Corythoichthys intestinalis TaxID=161448 RepID=UPI0025A62EC0|nr:glutaredoxin domain-containing cysteine-rich protein 2 isoform X2 [Corythoichthys intestinalis]